MENFSKVKTGTWANFISNEPDTVKVRSIIQEGMKLRVGNGNAIQFWHDSWCEVGVLKCLYPRLFAISLQKEYLIFQMGRWEENNWVWNLLWRRPLHDWELDDVRALLLIVEQNRPDRGTEEGIRWRNSEVASYPTKDIHEIFNNSLGAPLSKSITSVVWQRFIPPRARLIVWLAYKERLKTGDFLVEKGIISPQNAWCPFCKNEIETNTHILFTCRFAWCTWMEILKWWNLSAPLHRSFTLFSFQWCGLVKERKRKDFWILSLGCVIWSLWYERNKILFENKIPHLQSFVMSLKFRIGTWAKEMFGVSGYTPNVIFNADSFILQA